MVAITNVVDETVDVTETVVTVLENLSALNANFIDPSSYPPLILMDVMDTSTLFEDCCGQPQWLASIYMIDQGGLFTGGEIQVSYDGGITWTKRADYSVESICGVTVSGASGDRELGAPLPDRWDVYSQVTVEMINGGEFESRTREAVYAGANRVYIEGEVRAFSTVVEIDPVDSFSGGRTFVLTDWIRGMHQSPIGLARPVADRDQIGQSLVTDLSKPLTRVAMPYGDDDIPLLFRAIDKADLGSAINEGAEVTLTGKNLKPFKSTGLTVVRDALDNITISWSPVSRDDPCPQILSARGPSDGDPDNYIVTILSAAGGLVKRTTIVTDATSLVYPFPIQNIDFGSPQSTIYFTIIRTNAWSDGDAVESQG